MHWTPTVLEKVKVKNMSSKVLSYLVKGESVTIVFEDGPRNITKGHTNFQLVIDAIKKKQLDKLRDLVDIPKAVQSFTQGKCELKAGVVLFDGKPVSNYVVTKIFDLMREGLPFEHLLKFLDRLMANPSMRARDELYKFLETENLPITEDGCFLAYKSVRVDSYLDHHSGTIRNAVGDVVSMPRPAVDDNQQVGCSKGLHVGSLSYVENFHNGSGSVMVICKVDPADVVCIPVEDVRKIRCCKYEVLNHFTTKFQGSVYNATGGAALQGSARDDDVDDEVCDLDDGDHCLECGAECTPSDNFCRECGCPRF